MESNNSHKLSHLLSFANHTTQIAEVELKRKMDDLHSCEGRLRVAKFHEIQKSDCREERIPKLDYEK